jgi:hypothetical protein
MRGSRSAHTSANCASDWPRRWAIADSPRTLARFVSVSMSADIAPPVAMRESAGMPFR